MDYLFVPFIPPARTKPLSPRCRSVAAGSLIEAVRNQTRIVDLKHVNRVLIQPHWRKDCDTPVLS